MYFQHSTFGGGGGLPSSLCDHLLFKTIGYCPAIYKNKACPHSRFPFRKSNAVVVTKPTKEFQVLIKACNQLCLVTKELQGFIMPTFNSFVNRKFVESD